MVANFARRGQLSRENFLPCRPRSRLIIDFARQVRPPRPASACSFSLLRINMVFTRGIPPAFRDSIHIYRCQPASGQSRGYRVTQLRADDIYCRASAGTGPVVLKVVPITAAAFSGFAMNQFILEQRPKESIPCDFRPKQGKA